MVIQPDSAANEDLVTVFDTKDEAEAMVVHGLLESSGVDSIIFNPEVAQDVLPGVGEIIIRVRAKDADTARNIIAEQRQGMVSQEFNEADWETDGEKSA
jgi:Putative prokaryotic signal transducing protein